VPGDALVGKSIGRWWAGAWDRSCGLVERVDVIFLIFYEIDQQTVKTVLRLDDL
jgi:hypothetical protein